MTGSLWGLLTIVGPLLLAGVLIWATLNNRTSKAQKRETEAATKRLYEEQNAEDIKRDEGRL